MIQRNPLFGSFDFRNTPEMQSMIQGEGIIDIVNTYINLALRVGLVGLTLFVGFFVSILFGLRKALRAFPTATKKVACSAAPCWRRCWAFW